MPKKIASEWKLAEILNKWSHATFRNSGLAEYKKYSFLLRIFREVITQASDTMAYLDTEHLAPDHLFLSWLFETHFTPMQAPEIVETYLHTQMGAEFLLVMSIYFCQQFPERSEEVYSLMRHVDLLNEVRRYVDCEHVRQYLKFLYQLLGEQEMINDYLNLMEDQLLEFN